MFLQPQHESDKNISDVVVLNTQKDHLVHLSFRNFIMNGQAKMQIRVTVLWSQLQTAV